MPAQQTPERMVACSKESEHSSAAVNARAEPNDPPSHKRERKAIEDM